MKKALFQIPPLGCRICGKKIEDYFNQQIGIISIKVFDLLGKIRIKFDETKVLAETLEEIIENLGYPVLSKTLYEEEKR